MIAASGSLRSIIQLIRGVCISEGHVTWSGARRQHKRPEHRYTFRRALFCDFTRYVDSFRYILLWANIGEHIRPMLRDGVFGTICFMVDFDGPTFRGLCYFLFICWFGGIPGFRPADQIEVCSNRRGSGTIFRGGAGVDGRFLAPTLCRIEFSVGG